MKRKLFACFLALTMLTVLTACGGKAANSSASASADTSEAMVPDYTENDSYASYTGSDSGSGGFDETESLPTDAAEQKIIYTGDLNLETTDFDAATRSLSALAEELGGYVENSSIGSSSRGYRWADYTIRIPSGQFQRFFEQAGELAHETWRSTNQENITEVYSHPQGFSQCSLFFKEHPVMRQFNYFNTAKAAELVAEKKDPHMAAVAGVQAADQYGLEILARGINTNKSNYTRFIIISREQELVPEADKITLIVSLKHQPGSLYRLLAHFAQQNINMTNIESRPYPGRPWEYYFHMDITGHLTDPAVQEALQQLPEDTTECKILGNYPADHGKEA